ncbi:formate--tetrahydrofolate ligase [bacterium]|nr:formate--tetrahydrofolate ligase [bacterium]
MTDLEIARGVELRPIAEVAARLGIDSDRIVPYGRYIAKLPLDLLEPSGKARGRLILVSAISPTPAGEGKTTTTVGLTDALAKLGHSSMAVLREPSLGPVFGIKGGATGGGKAQLGPMEDINLHFTGDFNAVEKAHNLLSAYLDNHLHHGLEPYIDVRDILWKRVMDLSDRSLRSIVLGMGKKADGVPRQSGFDITVASEVMAVLCLSSGVADLKQRLGRIVLATDGIHTVQASDLGAEGSMAALLRDALKPNLVQTLEHNPALVHGGPFANIAQGTNTALATRMALGLADYAVTEAGFGFDLGGEKFLDIKCRETGMYPSAVVLVATIRALKYHGGIGLEQLTTPNVEALKLGFVNLEHHINSARLFGFDPVVALNHFPTDSSEETEALLGWCAALGVAAVRSEVWGQGGVGGVALAEAVVEACAKAPKTPRFLYERSDSLEAKIEKIARGLYGAASVEYSPKAKSRLKLARSLGMEEALVCMAKTQKSLSHNPAWLGAPKGYVFEISDLEIAAGAGFVVPIAGEMMRMPGLPARPAGLSMNLNDQGQIEGLF